MLSTNYGKIFDKYKRNFKKLPDQITPTNSSPFQKFTTFMPSICLKHLNTIKKYAIIDIETTGGSAQHDRITEIAVVLHDGKQVIDSYETLINPDCVIPDHITRITGINNEMVANAPMFYEVAKKIVEMTEGAIFVAHNVRFDYSFVRESFRKLGYTYTRRQLCTVKLTRKLFPGLPSYSLGKLALHFGFTFTQRHRAMGDTLVTVALFEKLLQAENNETAENDLVNLGIEESRLPEGVTLDQLHALPEECGVYYMHDANGNAAYIGKSINIKKRVMQHFSKTTSKSGLIHRFVRSLSYELTGSELVALLLESHEIKTLGPYINRSQRRRSFPYIIHQYKNTNGYICLDVQKVREKARNKLQMVSEYPKLGTAKNYLERAIEEYQLCRRLTGLESNIGACIYKQIGQCQGACAGEEDVESYNERVEEALEYLRTVFDEDFLIIDKGRHDDERSVIHIQNGKYCGFGYIAANCDTVDDMLLCIKPYQNNPEVIRLIRHYLAKHSKELRIVALKELRS